MEFFNLEKKKLIYDFRSIKAESKHILKFEVKSWILDSIPVKRVTGLTGFESEVWGRGGF